MKRVVILGCGPAGLFAAEACRRARVSYKILTNNVKPSYISGAQYLHEPIPQLCGEAEGTINYIKMGTRDGYAAKVYGNMAMPVSWDTFDEGERPFWSLRDAYAKAWEHHHEQIYDQAVTPKDVRKLIDLYDLVISTIPLIDICKGGHDFRGQRVYVSQAVLEHSWPNQILYNGQNGVAWYRWSVINGISCYEFSEKQHAQRGPKVIEIYKPLQNFCTCWPSMLRVGRYGEWKKGKLTHHAYKETLDALYNL